MKYVRVTTITGEDRERIERKHKFRTNTYVAYDCISRRTRLSFASNSHTRSVTYLYGSSFKELQRAYILCIPCGSSKSIFRAFVFVVVFFIFISAALLQRGGISVCIARVTSQKVDIIIILIIVITRITYVS